MRSNDEPASRSEPPEVGQELLGVQQMLAIADVLPMAMALVDRQRRYRFVNQSMADFFELPRAQIIGKSIADVIGAEALAAREERLIGAFAGERQRFTAAYPHPSRGPLTIQSDYLPQFGEDGQVEGLVILATDVTDQRATALALRESEERFRRIADSAPVIMWVTRLDRTRDFVNDAYAEFVGMPRADAQNYDWRHSIHPDDVDRLIEESLAGEASFRPFTLEGRFRRHDGEWRWLRSVSSPRLGSDGAPVGFIGAATDITIAKESELALIGQVEKRTAELADSEERVRAIFDTVLEVIVLMEPDGTIIEMNRIARPWRSENHEDAVGGKIWDAPTLKAYPEQVPVLKKAVAEAARGSPFSAEIKLERPDIGTHYLDFSIQPIRDGSGRVVNLLAEARDITDLKAAQEQLRQSQKMEALGQLTGGIAHDFNNLLTVVVGGLDIIQRQATDERVKRYAANAMTAAERGTRLTAQLLAFSRVQRLEVRPLLLTPLIEEMRPLLRNVLGAEIDERFQLDAAPVLVLGDPTQLELALLNLAINARDAMPDGGTLIVETHHVTVDADPDLEPGDYIQMSVSDVGVGMDAQTIERAFDPFFTTKEVGKGTGLGLSMVYGVARQSGGTARIRSTLGEGTTVDVFLRRADEASDEVAADKPVADHQSAPRDALILVIDDDPEVRDFMCDALEESGYRVDRAVDGPSGLDKFATRRPDLVVLDYAMPGMTGGEVASRIRKDVPDQKILFVSGYSESESIRRSAPDAMLLAKPFRLDALNEAVSHALRDG